MSAGGGGDSAALLKFIRQGRSFSGREAHCVFLNTHSHRFADVSSACGLALTDDGRALAQVDWDTDGDLDFWVTNRNGPQLRFMQNQLPQSGSFVAFKLQGTRCNRDAIGARLALYTEGQPLRVKSLRAGDGYLSQSSKWLHFGLSGADSIDSLVVMWPDGTRQTFAEVEIGRRYVVRQDANQLETWVAPRQKVELAGGAIETPQVVESHVLSLSKLPVPRLEYQDEDARRQHVVPPNHSGFVLLNLWAGWCGPCIAELAEWSARESELRSAGIDVVALTVSSLSGSSDAVASPSHAEAAERVARVLPGQEDLTRLDQIKFPFRRGVATETTVETLQVINNHLFDLHLPLPVPTSVLLNADGYLVGLYKGGVSVDRLLRDAAAYQESDQTRRRLASPGIGRWHEPLNRISMIPLLDELIQRGLLDQADDLVRRLTAARKEQLLPALVRLGMAYYDRGQWQKAQEHFSVAVRIDSRFVGVELALAQQREKEKRFDSAVKLYREALRRSPNNVSALNRLSWLLSTTTDVSLRDGKQAIKLASAAVERTKREDPATLDTLSAAYAAAGQFELAVKTARQASALAQGRGQLDLVREINSHLAAYYARKSLRFTATSEEPRPER